MAKTTRMAFTAEELEILKSALNNYSLEMMNKSETWGKDNSYGREDYYHRFAHKITDIWSRCYKASLRLEKAQTVTATEEVDG